MKKTVSIFLACVITAAALAGCSASSPESQPETAAAAKTTISETTAQTEQVPEPEVSQTQAEESQVSSDAALETPDTAISLRIGSLKGPTTMGLVSLMDQAASGQAKGSYEFTMVTAADELVGKIVSGGLDIALVPANMASILYQKTNGGIQVLNINTLGVLYVVTADDSIQKIPDLKGKTVYLTGKGTTPDYVFQYLLSANGLAADDVTLEYKSEATEVAAVLNHQPDAIGLLPQPFVTVAMAQNESLNMVLDLTQEWDNLQMEEGGGLVTGVTVCRKELLEDNASLEAVKLFMEEHSQSADFANNNIEETAQLVAEAGIIEKAPVAQKALPYCSITCIEGTEMKDMLSGYLNVLYQQDPSSVGGKLPDNEFYYEN